MYRNGDAWAYETLAEFNEMYGLGIDPHGNVNDTMKLIDVLHPEELFSLHGEAHEFIPKLLVILDEFYTSSQEAKYLGDGAISTAARPKKDYALLKKDIKRHARSCVTLIQVLINLHLKVILGKEPVVKQPSKKPVEKQDAKKAAEKQTAKSADKKDVKKALSKK